MAKKHEFKVTSKIFIDDKLVSSSHIVTYANQKSTLTIANKRGDQALKLSLTARNVETDKIKINYDIQYINGNEKIHTQPEMLLVLNQEGAIRIAYDFSHSYVMKVVVERQ